jgi:hypothetical protein
MSYTYIPRSLEPVLKKAVGQFPAVVLVSPCQSGKATIIDIRYPDNISKRVKLPKVCITRAPALRGAGCMLLIACLSCQVSRRLRRYCGQALLSRGDRHGFNLGIHLGTFFLYSMYSSPNFFSNPGSSEKLK